MERESSVKISATVYKQLEQQTKTVAYTDNGTYNVSPDPGYWLSNVNVEVHVDQNLSVISELSAVISGLNDQIATITSLTINENGTYTPPEGVLGYNDVLVNISFNGAPIEAFSRLNACTLNMTGLTYLSSELYPFLSYCRSLGLINFTQLESLVFPEGSIQYISYIPKLYKCTNLTELKFPNNTTNVVQQSFCGYCSSLTSVDFGNMTEITGYFSDAFRDCSALSNLDWLPPINGQSNTSQNIFGVYTFANCENLTTAHIIINNCVGSRVQWAYNFRNCSKLESVILSGTNNVLSTFSQMFYEDTMLKSIVIGNGYTFNISTFGGLNTFYKCTALTHLELHNISKLGNLGFSHCYNLTVGSLENILNALMTTTSAQTCTLGTTNLSKLSEEQIAIATNKGWTLN